MESDYEWKMKLKKYDRYKKFLSFMNASSGVWPNYKNHPLGLRIFLRCISAMASASVLYGIVMFDIKEVHSINTFTRGLGLLIASLSTLMKVINYKTLNIKNRLTKINFQGMHFHEVSKKFSLPQQKRLRKFRARHKRSWSTQLRS